MDDRNGIRLTDEQKRKQRARSIAIGLAIAALVILFYLITVLKLGPAVLIREL
jgi:hypothetical protein